VTQQVHMKVVNLNFMVFLLTRFDFVASMTTYETGGEHL